MHNKKSSILSEALDFATQAHEGQTRKGSNSPYIEHPLEVMGIAKTMTDDEETLSAAVLHDTVEDTPITIEDIQRKFGKNIASLVLSDTENKRENLPAEETWGIRKRETIEHLKNTKNKSEKIIILADKLSNMRQIATDYDRVGDQVWQRFHQKNKDKQAWYYKSILEATNDLKEYDAWQEYRDLVGRIFD